MQSKAATAQQYLSELPADRREPVTKLRNTVLKNLPKGFKEVMNYGMLCYVVPHDLFPPGYHCDPSQPLPFASIASQKNYISFYHMGIYGMPELLKWFVAEYSKHSSYKLDMGKGCIRFKKPEQIPYELIGQLMKKVTAEQWIKVCELAVERKKSG